MVEIAGGDYAAGIGEVVLVTSLRQEREPKRDSSLRSPTTAQEVRLEEKNWAAPLGMTGF